MIRHLFLSACLAGSTVAYADINIGQSVPTSGSAASSGEALAIGAAIYFAQVNARGGVNGEKINHIVLDDGHQANRTVNNTRTLLQRGAVGLVSYYGTENGYALQNSQLLEQNKLSLVGLHSGSEGLRRGNPYIFNTRASYTQEIDATLDLLTKHLGVTRIAVLVQNRQFAREAQKSLQESLAKRNLKPLIEASFNEGSALKPQAEQIARLRPEVVIVLANSVPAADFTKEFRKAGGNSNLYGLSTVQYEEMDKRVTRKVSHGFGISQVFPYPRDSRSRLARDFQNDAKAILQGAYEEYPSYALLEGYISARVMVEALRRAGKAPSADAVSKALASLGVIDLGGFKLNYAGGNRNGSRMVDLTMIAPSGGLTR